MPSPDPDLRPRSCPTCHSIGPVRFIPLTDGKPCTNPWHQPTPDEADLAEHDLRVLAAEAIDAFLDGHGWMQGDPMPEDLADVVLAAVLPTHRHTVLTEVADHFGQCLTCRHVHQPIPTPGDNWGAPSWASPDDGHTYRPRDHHTSQAIQRLAATIDQET